MSHSLIPALSSPARRWTTYFVFVASAVVFTNDNFLELTSVRGSSMAPALSPAHHDTGARDHVLWRKWSATSNLRRGDVVHFFNPSDPEVSAVKRVIALEGDTVLLDSRRRPGVGKPEDPAWCAWRGRVEIPPGHLWLEGDNWRSSRDSNYYGPVSKSLIDGRALCVLSPWGRAGTRPWEGFQSATKVKIGQGRRGKEWTVDGLPIELLEIAEAGTVPSLNAAESKSTGSMATEKSNSKRLSG